MATKSTKPDWSVSAPDYGKSLKGFGVNLLVRDVEANKRFAEDVFLATTVYWNEDFAVLRQGSVQWMLHADHCYEGHPLSGFVEGVEGRGRGVELHLYDDIDPDEAEARARVRGDLVLAGCLDTEHGVRECYILDPDGYCWVVSRALTG